MNAMKGGLAAVAMAVAVMLQGCSGWRFDDQVRSSPDARVVKCAGVEENRVTQDSPTSCWAACAEMIFRYNGRSEQTQAVIASRLGKLPRNDSRTGLPLSEVRRSAMIREACSLEIMVALYPEFGVAPEDIVTACALYHETPEGDLKGYMLDRGTDYLWKVFSQEILAADLIATELLGDPRRPEPMVVGIKSSEDPLGMGHAYLLYGMDYVPGSQTAVGGVAQGAGIDGYLPTLDRGEIRSLYLVDPADGSLTKMTGEELRRNAIFVMSRSIAKQRMEGAKDIILLRSR